VAASANPKTKTKKITFIKFIIKSLNLDQAVNFNNWDSLLHTAVWQAAPTLHKHWLWRKPRQSLAHCIVAVVEAVGTTVVEGTAAKDMSVATAIATVEELQS
jgi:hypothetical protein